MAEKIYLEHVKRVSTTVHALPNRSDGEAEAKYACLESCMQRPSVRNRELILAYYGNLEGSRTAARKDLAERLGLGANALWIGLEPRPLEAWRLPQSHPRRSAYGWRWL